MTQEPKPKHPHNRKKRHPNWGGRRPGAGARPGNMNALKHGRRSARMGKLGMMLAADPRTRAVLFAIADKWERKRMKATEVAADIFEQILERGIKIGEANAAQSRASRRSRSPHPLIDAVADETARLSVLPPTPDRRSIKSDGPETGSAPTGERVTNDPKKKFRPLNDQDRPTNPRVPSRSAQETALDRPP